MKKKFAKRASLVALSAVMACGVGLTTACGSNGDLDNTITVFIFCSATDADTNKQICDTWAKQYTQRLIQEGTLQEGEEIKVKFSYQDASDTYTSQLNNHFSVGEAEDVFYLSPKFIKAWAKGNRVLDLSEFINPNEAESLNGLWSDAIGFYGYSDDANYTQGEAITYKADGAQGAGMYTASGVKAGIYGLPKDYSNFAMAYNAKYYTEQMKEWMQKVGPTTSRNVKGAFGNTKNLTFTGSGCENVITYAVDVKADEAYDHQAHRKGDPAPFMNVGIPVCIKPFNFYRFESYNSAIAGGDPIAKATDQWAPDGYVVTMPGFPGDTFDVAATDKVKGTDMNAYNANANYAAERAYCTFTYAEYGALTWLTTYFCNTFNFWGAKNDNDLLNGTGGIVANGERVNVYGGGQYEGAPNPTLYTLPWLYGNDSDFINMAATDATNPGVNDGEKTYGSFKYGYSDYTKLDTIAKMQTAVAKQTSEDRSKLSVDGNTRTVETFYGVNSYNFLEMYGAFLEYASTWNGNSENCGDQASKENNSWANFRKGYNIFYGSGTWDAQARNEADLENLCTFATMPSAVGEKYALYSHVKDAFYNEQTYAWVSQGKDAQGRTIQKYWNGKELVQDNESAKRVTSSEGWGDDYLKVFSKEDIRQNQIARQDKWGARMDSVGYSVNGELKKYKGTENEWKLAGAVSLAVALSINEDAQKTLSYGGAQLPNFIEQCEDFLYYNIPNASHWTAERPYTEGAFKDMVTPEGFYNTGYWKLENGKYVVDAEKAAEAARIWDYYYDIIKEMDAKATALSTDKVGDFLAQYKAYGSQTEPLPYDHQYADKTFKEFTNIEISYRAYAMKILYMQTYTLSDRDLQIRMQAGLNSARDSAMYTYTTTWLTRVETRGGTSLAYDNANPIGSADITTLVQQIASKNVSKYMTAAVCCLQMSEQVAYDLAESRQKEKTAIDRGF